MADVLPDTVDCNSSLDRKFGPGVQCRQFDFTLFFEQSVFGIGVSSLFLLLVIVRFKVLFRAPIQTLTHPIYFVKICLACVIAALNAALLALWAKDPLTKASIAAAILGLVGALAVVLLEIIEHPKSTRPSTAVSLFLMLNVIGECVQIRTLFLRGFVQQIARVLTAEMGLKVALLIIESVPKTSYLKPKAGKYAPEETAGVISRGLLAWLNPLFWLGSRKILTNDDLLTLEDKLLGRHLQIHMSDSWEKNKAKGKWAYLYALWTCLKWPYYSTVLPRAFVIGFSFAQTFIINASVSYLETSATLRDKNHAYGLISAAVLIYGGVAISTAVYQYKNFKLASRFRGAAVSIIYQKALKAKSGYSEMASVTLMSTDVDNIVMSLLQLSDIWARFAELGIGIWLLWRQVGIVAVAPIVINILCFGLQSYCARMLPRAQKPWVEAIQRRVGLTTTVLQSIKAVKLAGLPESMIKLLQSERIRELNLAKSVRRWSVAQNVVVALSQTLSTLVVFSAYAIQEKIGDKPPLTAARAFTSLALLALLTNPAARLLAAYAQLAQGLSCVRRIQKFLEAEHRDDRRQIGSSQGVVDDNDKNSDMILVSDLVLTCSDTENPEKAVDKINFTAKRGSITAIFGPVGCGKSTLLTTLLGETNSKSGTVSIGTPYVGFCAQTAWVQNCSVRENIIGPIEFNEDWYWQVVTVCDLEVDLALMPKGDLTIVGSGGIILSGGQKHRIGLARVLYSRCSIYLLDDFFSSLDRKTRNTVMHRLFSEDGHVRKTASTVVLATHTRNCAKFVDKLLVLGNGGTQAYLGSPRNWDGHINEETPEKQQDDKTASSEKSRSHRSSSESKLPTQKEPETPKQITPQEKEEATSRQTGDMTVWLYYAKTMGLNLITIGFIMVLLWVFTMEFPRVWIKLNTGPNGTVHVARFIGIYLMLIAVSNIAFAAMIWHVLIFMVPKSAARLHHTLLNATFRAPMSFFANTDVGNIVNRFSQDMTLVDMQLPIAAWQVFFSFCIAVADAAFVCAGSQYMAATLPGIIVTVYFIQKYYLKTSRQLRLLDLESKSPLYSHFTETIDGLPSIRGFGWQQQFNEIALQRLDISQKPYHLLWCIQRWLNLVLELAGGGMGVIVIALALCIPSSTDAGFLGVALTSITQFNQSLAQMVMAWTQAETSIGAVTRTRSYEMETPTEGSKDDVEPDEHWPRGAVKVENMTITYEDDTVALKDISFTIEAGKKFGICGRSGSGKSTLISALLRLIDPSSGKILVDGEDIAKFRRNGVRERIICLPQEAILFPRTFQFNLDPEHRLTDDQADWTSEALRRVGLWDLVERRGGVDTQVDPQALSHGEKQLLALARAIIRRRLDNGRCILVLDEATSSLDEATQSKFQEIIDTDFKGNTVIAIAHRLETVRDMDTIVVLEKGEIVRMGIPSEVL